MISIKNSCAGCCRPTESSDSFCLDCKMWLKKYSKTTVNHHALFKYNDFAKEIMKQFKYQGDYILAHGFVNILRKIIQTRYSEYVICPIPSNQSNYIKRGFIPTECLLFTAGIPYTSLLKNVGKGSQAERKRKDRLVISQPFELIEGIEIPSKILLFDDVYTTGRTLLYAKGLLGFQGVKVRSLTLFR